MINGAAGLRTADLDAVAFAKEGVKEFAEEFAEEAAMELLRPGCRRRPQTGADKRCSGADTEGSACRM